MAKLCWHCDKPALNPAAKEMDRLCFDHQRERDNMEPATESYEPSAFAGIDEATRLRKMGVR